MRRSCLLTALLLSIAVIPSITSAQSRPDKAPDETAPLVIGETFTLSSKVLGEVRRINVYAPPGYAESRELRLPVLYMPDGGIGEDFLHVAGLVQVSVGNGTMRPFLLVGIENTERRRDMTGPTENEEDKKIAPRVGGSEAFRKFIRTELMPSVESRYRTTGETAIVGESLAGLFVVESFFLEPDLFDTYIAFDPSLWWNHELLLRSAGERLRARPASNTTLYFASSGQMGDLATRLAAVLKEGAFPGLVWHHEPMPDEQHSTIYHPAALRAFRKVFKPHAQPDQARKEPAMTTVSVRYIVDDVEAAIAFYTRHLDFHLDNHPAPGFAALSLGNLRLLLNAPGAGGAGQAMPDGRKPAPGGWNRIQIEVADLAAKVEALRKAGAHFRNDIVAGNGGKQILLDDPAGNCIELFEPPKR